MSLIDELKRRNVFKLSAAYLALGRVVTQVTATANHDTGLSEIVVQPLFANIRNDPRWLPFLRRIGKAPEQLAAIKFDVTLPE